METHNQSLLKLMLSWPGSIVIFVFSLIVSHYSTASIVQYNDGFSTSFYSALVRISAFLAVTISVFVGIRAVLNNWRQLYTSEHHSSPPLSLASITLAQTVAMTLFSVSLLINVVGAYIGWQRDQMLFDSKVTELSSIAIVIFSVVSICLLSTRRLSH